MAISRIVGIRFSPLFSGNISPYNHYLRNKIKCARNIQKMYVLSYKLKLKTPGRVDMRVIVWFNVGIQCSEVHQLLPPCFDFLYNLHSILHHQIIGFYEKPLYGCIAGQNQGKPSWLYGQFEAERLVRLFLETAFLPAPVTALRTWAATLRCRLPWRFRGPGDQRRSSRPHRYRRGREFCLPECW